MDALHIQYIRIIVIEIQRILLVELAVLKLF